MAIDGKLILLYDTLTLKGGATVTKPACAGYMTCIEILYLPYCRWSGIIGEKEKTMPYPDTTGWGRSGDRRIAL